MRIERNLKLYAGLGSGVLILGCLLALALPLGQPAAKSPGSAAAAAGARPGPDLDGDGRPDKVLISADAVKVTAANGATLLEYSGKLRRPEYTVLRLAGDHGPVPVLFLQSAENEYSAFTYDPSRGLLQAMTWPDGAAVGRGQLSAEGDLVQPVLTGEIVRRRVTHLTVNKLSLKSASQVLQPLKESRKLPSEALAAAVEAAMFGLKDEMAIHFPDPDVARDFYAKWHGKLPATGIALVAQADDVDAGAEHGHLVPVTVWVAGDDTVAGLKGEAEFVSGPTGVQILRINLNEQPLKVTSWSDAARRIKVKRPLAGQLQRAADAPFYGRFRFVNGANRFAIDALTGTVEDE